MEQLMIPVIETDQGLNLYSGVYDPYDFQQVLNLAEPQ